ncbi:MAG: helix-turn-helix transcriptional regulator [Patescibacteria group bacterium]|nr:helix-turn-helix transcriptional regulator [Patescibacteria group bacterium]
MLKPGYRKAYDALEVEYQIIDSVLRKRLELDMTQADLARKIKSDQSVISRLEAGTYNPSIKFLKRVAKALGTKLTVSLA